MPRHKKTDKDKLAELLGIEIPKQELGPMEHPYEVSREAEAVLAYKDDASYFITKNCKSCGRMFAHTKGAVAYCSDPCRAVALEKIGIKWHWLKPPEYRWGKYTEPPLVVPPEPLSILQSQPEPEPEEQQPETDLYSSVLDLLEEFGLP